jgi:anti-sigma factor RsiW
MIISDAELIAFLQGELPDAQLAAIEAALAADPALAARAEALMSYPAGLDATALDPPALDLPALDLPALDLHVRAAFDPVLAEPLPPALLAAASPAVIDLAAARAARQPAGPPAGWRRWGQGAALAASLAVGILIGTGLPDTGSREAPLIIADADGTRAGPALAAALASTRSGVDAAVPGGVMRPVISVRAGDGRLCRQFAVQQDASALAALACRQKDQWQIVVASSSTASRADFALAAGPGEAAIEAALAALQAGEPLDAEGEAKALSSR